MNHIFISYSHGDSGIAGLLEDILSIGGYKVWRDVNKIRVGSTLSKEVARAIDDSSVFISLMTPRFADSTWLDNELTRAINQKIPVIPLVFDGTNPPIQVDGALQFRIAPLDQDAKASEMFSLLQRIKPVLDEALAEEEENCDSSDGEDDWGDNDDLIEALVGTRWSWCENANFEPEEKWIEFQANGRLKRSWQTNTTRWAVSPNGFVLYTPHVLCFDIRNGTFQGATSNPEQQNPERSGRRLK